MKTNFHHTMDEVRELHERMRGNLALIKRDFPTEYQHIADLRRAMELVGYELNEIFGRRKD